MKCCSTRLPCTMGRVISQAASAKLCTDLFTIELQGSALGDEKVCISTVMLSKCKSCLISFPSFAHTLPPPPPPTPNCALPAISYAACCFTPCLSDFPSPSTLPASLHFTSPLPPLSPYLPFPPPPPICSHRKRREVPRGGP